MGRLLGADNRPMHYQCTSRRNDRSFRELASGIEDTVDTVNACI